jgi:putative membrane-bound dehydrogenase-like protein
MELWASEPDIVDPVGLTFGAAGRAYVLEMRDYPYGMDGKGQPGGTVRLLEDTNSDGRPDKSSLFAENLRFPTSICAVKDGVVVSAPPDIIFLADRDGDGKAEVRETWFTGFTAGVTDSNFSGLRWHMDGRIHGVNGGNGGEVFSPRSPDKKTRLAELDFAFDPQSFDFITTYPTGGGFGLIYDDAGRSFVTHNINHMQMRILPQRILDEVPGGSALRGTQNISIHGENTRIYPIREAETRPNHPEQAGYFSSSGGMGYLNHSGWPSGMANSLFVCDAASGIVHREILSADGPIVKCERPPDEQTGEFLAGRDPSFRPVGVELGPDGALYILDMQRDVIEHPDYIPPRMKSKADLRAGSDRGRIWRVTPKAGLPKPDKLPALASTEERVALLFSSNQWTRLTAQRLLIEQPDEKAIPLLHRALTDRTSRVRGPIHHLFALTLLSQLTSADITAAVAHPSPDVRAAAIRCACAAPPDIIAAARPSLNALQNDPSPSVRGNLLLFAKLLSLNDTDAIALRALERDAANPWMRASALRLLGKQSAAAAVDFVKSGAVKEPAALRDIAAAQTQPAAVAALLQAVAPMSDAAFSAAAEGIAALPHTAKTIPFSARFMDENRPARLDAIFSLGMTLMDSASGQALGRESPLLKNWKQLILAKSGPENTTDRAAWIRLLRHVGGGSGLFQALRASEPPDVQQAALACLLLDYPADRPGVTAIVEQWTQISATVRPAVTNIFLRNRETCLVLAEALVSGAIKPGELNLDLEQRRTLLRDSGAVVRRMVSKFLTDDEYSNRAALVDQWLPKLPATGDPAKGKTAFQKLCFQCHRAGDVGHEVGPALAAQSHRSVEDLLTHILDPDAAINPNYAAYLAETTDGQKHTGILVSSSGPNVVLLQAMAVKTEIPRAKIKSLQSTGHSLMPAGMETAYTPQEMRDLIAFLQQR